MAKNWWEDAPKADDNNWWASAPVADEAKQELPEGVKPSTAGAGRGSVNPPSVQPKQPGLIEGTLRSMFGTREEPTGSVLDGYQPTAEDLNADRDRRLSYGAGPINQSVVRAADQVARGQAQTTSPTVAKVADSISANRRSGKTTDPFEAAANPANARAVRDAKAAEFRSLGEFGRDTAIDLTTGVLTLAQLPANIIAPDSPFAEDARSAQKFLRSQESSIAAANRSLLADRVKNEEGFVNQYLATAAELLTNPTITISETVRQIPMFIGILGASKIAGMAGSGLVSAAGRASPTLALGEAISGGAIKAAAGSAGATAGGIGATMAMAGGDAAGSTYEQLTDRRQTPLSVWRSNADFQRLVAGGMSEDAAIQEIAKTKARMAAAMAAPLGLLGYVGAEAAFINRIAKKQAGSPGKTFAKEVVGEQLEEGGTQAVGNIATSTVDPNQGITEGVAQAMATAGITSAPFAAAGAAAEMLPRGGTPDTAAGGMIASALLNPNNYDPGLVDPRQTRKPGVVSFTPPDSPTAEAGLPPIVVPGVANGSPDAPDAIPAVGSQRSGADAAGGLAVPVADGGLSEVGLGGGAQGVAAGGQAAAVVPGADGQPAADLTARTNLATRTSDADLLSRVEAPAQAQQQEPQVTWYGRRADGYVTQADAEQALPGRQRRDPGLEWRVESMPGGKFRLAGYELGGSRQQAEPKAADGWSRFAPETGTLGIPRAEMPQIKAEARGALVGFMKARGIDSQQEQDVDAATLRPTQAEYSPEKVQQAADFKGGDRSILVSADNHILDGHHQWLARLQAGEPVKVTRLNAPIARLLQEVKAMPSATTDTSSELRAVTGKEFLKTGETDGIGRITFARGELGAVKIGVARRLATEFNRTEQPDGSVVFSRKETANVDARGTGQGLAGQTRETVGRSPGVQRRDALPSEQPAGASQVSGRAAEDGGASPDVQRDLRSIERGWRQRTGSDVRLSVVRPRETANSRLAEVIARAFSAPINFIRGADGFDAMTINGRLYVNADDTDAPAMALVMHEIGHNLPEDLKQDMIDAIMATVTPEQRARFLREFSAYASDSEAMQNEELAMRIIEQDAQNADFWQALADRMGDTSFARLAREIIGILDRLLAGFRREDSNEFTSDIRAVREAVADAYAQALERQGGQPSVARRKKEQVGDFQVVTDKDGAITVLGDPDAIREQIPEDVKGRVTADGIRFVTADAQRVRAALEGRQVAYSRAGAVLAQKPMRDGKYLGAPQKFDTPAKIPTLRKWLRQLATEGEAGRYWYENSSREVLRMVGGDVQEARKFVALLAIYSPQAKVDANSTFALRAWAQYKAGQPISVKTAVMDAKAQAALDDVDAFWSGEKTGNFFFNLLREIDPTTEGKQGATIDMWMMRAGQYDSDAPTATQYAFMEDETNRLASELGWEPQQVQAAIWVAMKARMENSGVKKRTEEISERRKWIRFERNDKGVKVRVILDAQKHRDNWLKQAFAHDPSSDDTQAAKFDFSDGLLRHIGQVSFEARPGRTTGVLPGIHSAPYAQQVEFQQAVQRAFYDDQGRDLLAHYLGLLVDNDILAPGVWQGEVSPSSQKLVAMAPAKGDDGKSRVDPAQAKLLNIYASVAGLLARQEGVGWHRPFYATTKRVANALDIDIGRPANPRETQDLETAIGNWMAANGHPGWQDRFAFVSSPKGIRVVNFGIITNDILQTEIVKVAESVLPKFDYRVFASDGDMPTNDWKENSDGQGYVQRIRAEGRPDVLDWARTVLAPRVQRVFADFGERYDWGDAGELRFSAARDGGRRPESGRTAPGSLETPERAAAQKALTPLPGAPNVPGFHGPDPRLVAVAEKYAAANGIDLRRQAEYVQVDPERAARIAATYDAMPHAPQDPAVREAYENLIRQTRAQYDALVADGYKFWFINLNKPDNVEYASTPWNSMRDIRANKRMGVFPTDDGFGSSADFDPANNPLLVDTGLRWPSGSLYGPVKRVLANDLFRAVHDAFGHGLEGSGFRAQGEENAWQAHVRLFTGSAVGAITSETRGQNSWLNYGPFGEANRTAKVEDTVFADQKTGLMPEWTWTEGRAGDMPMASARRGQTDMFSGDFANRGTTVSTSRVIGSDGTTERGGNVDSSGNRIASTKQGLQNFWNWFGNSEAVDDQGRPQVYYHTTRADFSRFEANRVTKNSGTFGDWETSRAAMFFTDSVEDSQAYATMDGKFREGANVMPVYIKAENVLDMTPGYLPMYGKDEDRIREAGLSPRYFERFDWSKFDDEDGREMVDGLKRAGYDAIKFWDENPDTQESFVALAVFDPEQIKSAVGNIGTFDPTNPDIRASARRNAMGFYSELAAQVEKGPGQAMPDQWKAYIKGLTTKGVKPDEIEWSGINDWLDLQQSFDGKSFEADIVNDGRMLSPAERKRLASNPGKASKKITRESVLAYLNANGVKVDEVLMDGKPVSGELTNRQRLNIEYERAVQEALDVDASANPSYIETLPVEKRLPEEQAVLEAWYAVNESPDEQAFVEVRPSPRYEQHTLPGGENYREVLLTLPTGGGDSYSVSPDVERVIRELPTGVVEALPDGAIEPFAESIADRYGVRRDEMLRGIRFIRGESPKPGIRVNHRSHHWDQPNVIAHIRVNDRTDADGARVLLVEEIQSDWGQEGKKRGFAAQSNPARLQEINARLRQLAKADMESDPEWDALTKEKEELTRAGVPLAPFVTKTDGWLNLALKRIVAMAADGGYDKVAFVNGQQSADRYDLSKQVERIEYDFLPADTAGVIKAFGFDGEQVVNRAAKPEELPDIIGKEVAAKLMAEPSVAGTRTLTGDDLKVGGEGMKTFYDVIVPNAVKALLKKTGGGQVERVRIEQGGNNARVGAPDDAWPFVVYIGDREVNRVATREVAEMEVADLRESGKDARYEQRLDTSSEQPGFTITDAMRDKVSQGLPLFSARRNPQTETPEFKAWFGDSKVVDAEGKPLVVYHGTKGDFSEFDGEAVGRNFRDSAGGFFFTGNPRLASAYAQTRGGEGGNVMPAYVALKNPLTLDDYLWSISSNAKAELDDRGISLSDLFDESSAAAVEYARTEGRDGILWQRGGDTFVVAFRPEQIKSATGNSGAFDPNDPDIRASARRQPIVGASFTLPGEGRWIEARRALQDYFLRVRQVQDALITQGGTVGESQDVYRAEERSYGRIQEQIRDFADKWVKPLIERAGKAGVELDELALYAYARHAEERNADIAAKNPRLPDGGSGMTDAEAKQILAKFRAEGKEADLRALHADLMAITATTRMVLLDEGLISQEEYDALESQYSDYVPLRGFEQADQDGKRVLRTAGGKGFNIRGAETMKALGRTTRAGNILENIISDYERAIVRAERNNVGKAFIDLITTNPDPDLWEIDAVRTTRSIDPKTGQVRYKRIVDKSEDTIGVKVGGKEVYVRINDPLLLRAMRQAYRDDTATVPRWLQNTLGLYTTWMRNVLTRYNVAFSAVNAVRDAQAGAIAVTDDLGAEGLKLYAKYYKQAMGSAFRNEVGTLDQNSRQSDRFFEEFRAAGGTTGGFFMRDAEEIRADLRSIMLAAGSAPQTRMEKIKTLGGLATKGPKIAGKRVSAYNATRALLRTLEILGSASENAARVAAYRAAREMGKTPAEAASIAKNLTTNFNRKGEWGHLVNSLYLFFNAAVQGTARVAKALKNPKVQALMATSTAAAMGLAFMGAGMGDDEDGEAYWDKIPEYEKERNLVIMLPPGFEMDGAEVVGKNGRYIKIPMPYGFNVFPVLGYQLADLMRYAGDRNRGASPAKAAVRMVSAIAGSYNPLGGSFDPSDPVQLGMALSPTAGDLAIQLAAGVNPFGQKVGQIKTPYDPRPDSEIAGPREAGSVSQRLARWMNAATGGNAGRSGAVDVQPATINNLAKTFGGGAGDFLWQVLVNLPAKAMTPEAEISLREVPILKAFAGSVDKDTDVRRFYENREAALKEFNAAVREMKLGVEVNYDSESRGLQALGKSADEVIKAISKLRREEVRIEDDETMTKGEKIVARREIEKQRVQLARDFNTLFNEVMRDARNSQ